MSTPPLPPRLDGPPVPVKRGSRRKFISAILGALLIFLIGGTWLAVSTFHHFARKLEAAFERRQPAVAAPVYEPLLGQNLVGAGFHVQIGDRRCICASVHQFAGQKPETMGSLDFEEPIQLKEVIHRQADLQLMTYVCPKLDELPPLKFSPDEKIGVGLPVYLYPMNGGPTKAHVRSVSAARNTVVIYTPLPIETAGMSGSPIVSGKTGLVIGILTDANDPDHATLIGAELIHLPKDFFK